jgi:hypothetical protein
MLPDAVLPLDAVPLLAVVLPQMPAVDARSPFWERHLQKEDQRGMDRIGLV